MMYRTVAYSAVKPGPWRCIDPLHTSRLRTRLAEPADDKPSTGAGIRAAALQRRPTHPHQHRPRARSGVCRHAAELGAAQAPAGAGKLAPAAAAQQALRQVGLGPNPNPIISTPPDLAARRPGASPTSSTRRRRGSSRGRRGWPPGRPTGSHASAAQAGPQMRRGAAGQATCNAFSRCAYAPSLAGARSRPSRSSALTPGDRRLQMSRPAAADRSGRVG